MIENMTEFLKEIRAIVSDRLDLTRDLSDDDTFKATVSEEIDVEGALDIWMYLQAVLGIDNRGKNMYYVAKNIGAAQKIYFAPWDMDITWGDALSAGTGDAIWDLGLNSNLYSERINWAIGDRLVKLDAENSHAYIAETWKYLRQTVFSEEHLVERIDELAHRVNDSGAYARNAERWPDSNADADYEQFKRMALYRMNILDYYFDGNLDVYLGLGYQ